MNINTKNKIYILSILFALLALLLMVFFIFPTLQDIKNSSYEIRSNKSELIFLNEQSKALDNFEEYYKNYELNFEKIDELLIDPQNPIDFIKFLETTALDSGVSLDVNLVPLEKRGVSDNLPVAVFHIITKGDFLSMVTFSEKLENGPYLIKIKNLTIKKSNNNVSNVDAEFFIEVVTK